MCKCLFCKEYGTISDEAVISGIKDESLDIYLFRIGVPLRVGNQCKYSCLFVGNALSVFAFFL